MIHIDRLTKRYSKDQAAIDQLCLEVKEREIFGFLGPNGAGKTTTIRILTTLSLPTEGSAKVAGYDVVSHPQQVRGLIGYVAQESGVEYLSRSPTSYLKGIHILRGNIFLGIDLAGKDSFDI